MNYISRPFTHFTIVPGRPIVAVVLHNTEGTTPVQTKDVSGSWHWLIDRDGTCYQDVLEAHAAWAVAATDEWRPPWVRSCPAKYRPLSDANYCTISIELVSGLPHRLAGEPYTAAQYASLGVLLVDITARRGPLPLVAHGQLQLDRTDPVAFDWLRAGLAWDGTKAGYFPLPPDPPPVPPVEDVEMLTDEQAAAVAAALWAQRNQVFVPDFALPAAWLAEWRAGRYRGLPTTPELDGPDGIKAQAFDGGAAVWVPASGVSWDA